MRFANYERFPVDLARMHLLNPPAEGRPEVQILGITSNRIDLLSPIPVMPGTLIQLRLRDQDTFLLGEARRCWAVGNTFQVYMEIQDVHAARA